MTDRHELQILPCVRAGDEVAATRIYCEALTQKLAPFFGTAAGAAEFLTPHLRADRAVTAILDGRIAGVSGYHLDGAGLFEPRFAHFRARFGLGGATWRVFGLSLLEKEEATDTLAMDGIAVAGHARGQGIGTALLASVAGIARAAGKKLVRLDVIDTNPRARALYERFGFKASGTRDLGPFRHIFGFRTATSMTLDVEGGGHA
jgi:ribosomal protein S18 acetylase RimI-like enzyme